MKEHKERDKSKKRNAIIQSAEDTFIRLGYEKASMDKIAENAGISKKTVYNHFKNKESLFEVIVDGLLEQRQNLKSIIYDAKKTLEEQLILFAESEISLINSEHKLKLSRFLTLTFLNDLEFQRRVVSKHTSMHRDLIAWLEAAKEDNKINTENIHMASVMFYAMVTGSITWPVLFTDGLNEEATKLFLDEIIKLFLTRYSEPSTD